MCRTELQTKSEPQRMKIDDIRLIVAHNLNVVRSDIIHIMRNETLSDEWLVNTMGRSSDNVSSDAGSDAGDTEREDPPVSSAPSTAVSEAGDTEQPSAVPDAEDTNEQQSLINAFGLRTNAGDMDSDDDSDDGSSGIEEYTNDDYDSDSDEDPLEQHYVNAVHALNFHSNYINVCKCPIDLDEFPKSSA